LARMRVQGHLVVRSRINMLMKGRVTAGAAVTLLALVFVLIFIIGLNVGSADLDVVRLMVQTVTGDTDSHYRFKMYILTDIRLPRLVLCMLTAVALGLSGCIMQNLLRNPLASPYTLGVSSGASFGAALAMVLGYSFFGANLMFTGYTAVAFSAFLFGCLSLGVVYGISKLCNNSITVLILTGTAIGSLFSAGLSILKYMSNAEALKDLEIWLMGGFWGANWNAIEIVIPFIILGFIIVFKYAWDFNALNAGEDVASTLGVNVKRLKTVSLITVTLISSICIAFSGVIGFVGLVSPHIARSLVGVDNRYLIPASGLIGGIMLLASDIIARTVMSPEEIPVGIITSIIGVPFFIFILTKKKKQLWRD
jgi:iron complex transport system permease protein